MPARAPLGMYAVRMDEKGRIKLPVDFQTFFGAFEDKKLFVTSLDGVIGQSYPLSVWWHNENLLRNSPDDPNVVSDVLFNAMDLGAEAEIDGSGRITVNTQLREELGWVGQELHLWAVKGRVDILNEEQYKERRRQAREGLAENGKRRATENVRLLEQKGLM